jgi:hypothetical protein
MDLHAGAVVDRPPGPKYTATLHFAELSFPGALPKVGTLARFRAALPEGFLCALVVPPSCLRGAGGPLRMDDELEARLTWVSEAAEALAARALVVATRPDVTPGQRDRDRLAAYFARLPRTGGRDLVWAPRGLWEREDVERFAEREGLLAAFDPLEDPAPAGPVLYARVRTIGARSRISSGMLVDLADRLFDTDAEQAFVSIESPRSFREAAALQAIAAGQEAPELPE